MNEILLAGTVTSEPIISYELNKEVFYQFYLSCNRMSGTKDVIKCIIPECINNIEKDSKIKLSGEIRTRNYESDGANHLDVYVFVKELQNYERDMNDVNLVGFICKEPKYRKTPLNRELTECIISCKRLSARHDYIPTVVWGRNAIRTSKMLVGTNVDIFGRLQSREYIKKFDDGTELKKVAYELSVSKIFSIENEEE